MSMDPTSWCNVQPLIMDEGWDDRPPGTDRTPTLGLQRHNSPRNPRAESLCAASTSLFQVILKVVALGLHLLSSSFMLQTSGGSRVVKMGVFVCGTALWQSCQPV